MFVNRIEAQVFTFEPDTTSVLRNPAMGWTLYEEGASFLEKDREYYDPVKFWKEMDEVNASSYANILYIRVLWQVMEPEEGKFAWIYNEEYKEYIRKARSRGLKLAFRIFFDNGVPDWVYAAGCHSTLEPPMNLKSDKQPYYDDPIFLNKLEHFIKAFAKEYDNPAEVDFVDAYGLGRWGEGHGVTLKYASNRSNVIQRVTECYAKYFTKILTVYNLSMADWDISKPLVYDKLGFLPRRDGIGSHWYDDQERNCMKELFPDKAVIGEGCYWFGYSKKDTTYDDQTDFINDPRFPGMKNWSDVLSVSVDDAIASRSNTYDLRTPFECKVWLEQLPHKVQQFITHGGYRLFPDTIQVVKNENVLTISHSWKNRGIGVLPNKHPNWNYKYKVCFAVMDISTGNIIATHIDSKAEPSDWLLNNSYWYQVKMDLSSLPKSYNYKLAVAIIDTTTNKPGIILSVDNSLLKDGWLLLSSI